MNRKLDIPKMNNAFVRQDKTAILFIPGTLKKKTLKKRQYYLCKVQATWKIAKKLI